VTQDTPSPTLEKEDLAPDPVEQFDRWFEVAARESDLAHPEAMCLSTLDKDGWPDGRIVLLKSVDHRGFVFYTNTESRKGRALERNPRAALTFYWEARERQVRVVGTVEPVSEAEADEYFASRPRGSQIGAWASRQSRPLASREELEAAVAEVEERYASDPVPRPSYWSGYRVVHHQVEFWQGRVSRLHDRFTYRRSPDGGWLSERLYP
jgi:pyridoxamine 5'-phosphate oxidase